MENHTIIDATEINEAKEIIIASRGIRFLNFLIDYAIIFVLVLFTGPFLFGMEMISDALVSRLIFVLYFIGYYFILEKATNGKTLAKYITRTRAIKENGGNATTWDFLKRSLVRLIPFEPFSIFGDQAWHDSIPDMVVVKE